VLVQAAWAAIRTPGRLQARYHRLVRRMGGPTNPAAVKKAIVAIAHTLLKIACSVLRTGKAYQDPGPEFYTQRQDPQRRQAWLQQQIQKLHPGATITITITQPPSLTPSTALPGT
jgi:transposase